MLDLDSRDCEFEYKRLGRCGRMAHSPSSYFSSALMSRIKVTTYCTDPGIVTIHVLGGHWQPLLARIFKAFPKRGSRGRIKFKHVICYKKSIVPTIEYYQLLVIKHQIISNVSASKMHFALTESLIDYLYSIHTCKIVCEVFYTISP